MVTYFGFFMTGNRINLVLEYMDAGSFDTIIKRVPSGLPEEAVAVACHQLLLALQGMHDIHPRFIHRDIKPGVCVFRFPFANLARVLCRCLFSMLLHVRVCIDVHIYFCVCVCVCLSLSLSSAWIFFLVVFPLVSCTVSLIECLAAFIATSFFSHSEHLGQSQRPGQAF